MNSLEDEFKARVISAIKEFRLLGCHPNYVSKVLTKYGASNLAEKLATSGEYETDLKRLKELNRLDLSIESIMLEDRFRPLFSEAVREAAWWRLSQIFCNKNN